LRAIIVALLLAITAPAFSEPSKLLLTPQRLRRLQRDRERQTDRWLNFEKRVQTVPDSPERGFELALYYAVSQDEQRGREAIKWALAHQCELRQIALVLDWTDALLSPQERQTLAAPVCSAKRGIGMAGLRNMEFAAVAGGSGDGAGGDVISDAIVDSAVPEAPEMYAMIEYLDAVRTSRHVDLRRQDTVFFSDLPASFLLSMRPQELEHPSWMAHVAALALVTLDPNLESSQFLQAWAMEDRFTLRDGPGVAYEFLWANPYLPGVGYQNMEPWLYSQKGSLLARTDWTQQACWIHLSKSGAQDQNCPPDWKSKSMKFGRLTLVPMQQRCIESPASKNSDSVLLWSPKPSANLTYTEDGQQRSAPADASGLWRVPLNVSGKVCMAR
jgi:hypothetical protein